MVGDGVLQVSGLDVFLKAVAVSEKPSWGLEVVGCVPLSFPPGWWGESSVHEGLSAALMVAPRSR